MSFRDKGFLDDALDGWIQKIYDDNKDIFNVCLRLSELMVKIQLELKADVNDIRQLLIACLYIRTVGSCQAVILLLQRGMLKDGTILARALMDAVFRMRAIEVDVKVAVKYIKEDDSIRRKLANKYNLLSNDVKETQKSEQLKKLATSLDRHAELKSQWFADRAGLSDDYNSMYSLLSNEVHMNVRSIDDLVDRDASDIVLGFKIGPSDSKRQLMLILALAGKYGMLSVESCFNVLELGEHEELRDVPEKLKALREQLLPIEKRLLVRSP